jgi:hypothetical protein
MEKIIYSKKAHKTFSSFVLVVTILITLAGIFTTWKAGEMVDDKQREKLLLRAENASILINENEVKKLSGTSSDLSLPEYQTLKGKMVALKNTNPDSRFFYLMGLKGESQMFFFVDSEDSISEDYSAPGDPFNEPTIQELVDFKNGISSTQGPVSDSWGTWVSAYAPIKDSSTGETIAVIGIDIDAKEFKSAIIATRMLTGGATIFIFLFLLTLVLYIKKSRETIEYINRQSDEMALSYSYLKEAESIASLGRFSLNVLTKDMEWDETTFEIFSTTKISKPTFDLFISRISPEDKERVVKVFDEATSRGLDSFKTSFFVIGDGTNKKVLVTGTVRGTQNGKPVRIIGTIQDITGNA